MRQWAITARYIADRPEQQQLLPSALQDWLPEGHLAYFIDNTVDSLDLAAFHARPAKGGLGNQPFRSAMMVKVIGRAGGGFNYSFNAQTAVDEAAHTIVAAEVLNTSLDVQQLPMVLDLRSLKSLCRLRF